MSQSKRNSREVKGALVGTLLGDSFITNRGEFGCQQVNRELIDIKTEILKNISPDIKAYNYTRPPRSNELVKNCKESYVVLTNKNQYFTKLRNILYASGTKQISMKVLNKLTPEGIAFWFMDDGYFDYKQSKHTRNLRLCTDSFDTLSISNMIRYFNDVHNIQAKVLYHKARKNYEPKPRLSFNAENAQKLITLIFPYIIPSFYYKIDLKYEDKTLLSKRCSSDYVEIANYISQHIPR